MTNYPDITYDSLAYIDIESLNSVFNESFKNYFVPLHLTTEQLLARIYAEAIDLKLSYGAFHNKNLVAFILHGIDTLDNEKVAHNAGTGVLPEHRGKGLSLSLYEYAISDLKKNGFNNSTLEVFVDNLPAIKTYERIGFTPVRKLLCYKGNTKSKIDLSVEIRMLPEPDWYLVEDTCEWRRSWQYNNNTLRRGWNNFVMLTAQTEGAVKAYCIVNMKNGRVANFGVINNNSFNYVSALFEYIERTINLPLMIINIDESAQESNTYLNSIGFQQFLPSYEMNKKIL